MAGRSSRRGFTLFELFVVAAIITFLIGLLLPAIQNARNSARRTQCLNNLAQIGLALRNYEVAFDVLPPGTVNRTGPVVNKPTAGAYHVSWTVAVLPYLELSRVYNHFDFRRGVYDRRNRPVLRCAVTTYQCPAPGSYAGCHAGRETPIDITNDGCLFLNSAVALDDVADGCANTIVVGETRGGGGVWGWTSGTRDTLRNTGAPPNTATLLPGGGVNEVEDFSGQAGTEADGRDAMIGEDLDPAKAPPGLLAVGGFASNHTGGAQFAFCDGAVRFVNDEIDRTVFRDLGSRNDGALPGEF
jgi:prepilin-type processing-associated H-X9-DG protein